MRYVTLVALNVPIIFLALINIITQHKLKHVTQERFRHQIMLWLAILVILIGSFPFYNYLTGQPPLDSSELSIFDIVQTTAIIYLFYIINDHRRKIERNERVIRDLHQELSIKLSTEKYGKS